MRKVARAAIAIVIAATSGCDATKKLTGGGDRAGDAGGNLATSAPATGPVGPVTVTTIAPTSEGAWGVAIDATHVYFTTITGPAQGVRRKERSADAKAPSTSVCRIGDGSLSPETVMVDATHVYFIAAALGPGAIYRAPKGAAGIECEKVVSGFGFLQNRGLTKQGDTVYALGSTKKGSTLVAIDAAGKSRTIAELPKPADGVASDGTSLFFGSKEGMAEVAIMKMPAAGGAASKIGKGGLGLRFIDGRLYFIGAGLQSIPAAGGEPVSSGKPGGYADYAIAGGRAYVGGQSGLDDGFVMRGAIAAPELAKHASFKGGVVTIAADARDVYVTTTRKEVLRISP